MPEYTKCRLHRIAGNCGAKLMKVSLKQWRSNGVANNCFNAVRKKPEANMK